MTRGVADVDSGHHTGRRYARPTSQHRLRAMPRPEASVMCMQTSDASESHTCPLLGAALTDAIFTLRARAARVARRTPCAVPASHKNMGVSADFFALIAAPSGYTLF